MSGPPDLPGVVAAFLAAGAEHVVIGGFAVIAHEYVRATEDVDLLIPADTDNDARVAEALRSLGARLKPGTSEVDAQLIGSRAHLRLDCGEHGLVDVLTEGEPPLDFATVSRQSIVATVRGTDVRFAGLASIVALKRLAGRPRDRLDLEALAEIHGELPIEPLPEVD